MSYLKKVQMQRGATKDATRKDKVRKLLASAAGLLALGRKDIDGPVIPIEWGVTGWVCSECKQVLLDRTAMQEDGRYAREHGSYAGVVPHTRRNCLGLANVARTS